MIVTATTAVCCTVVPPDVAVALIVISELPAGGPVVDLLPLLPHAVSPHAMAEHTKIKLPVRKICRRRRRRIGQIRTQQCTDTKPAIVLAQIGAKVPLRACVCPDVEIATESVPLCPAVRLRLTGVKAQDTPLGKPEHDAAICPLNVAFATN